MKTFLILGGDSILARCFSSLYGDECIILDKSQCDITDKSAVHAAIKKHETQFVLNCAAIVDLDLCEKNPLLCLTVNTSGVYILAEACSAYHRKLIHLSSDYAVNPINTYGWSKCLSEQFLYERHLVVRTNFYHPGTFIAKELLRGHRINVYANVNFNPISVNQLALEIYLLKKEIGIKNIFTNKEISYFEFAKKFCKTFGLDDAKLLTPTQFENDPQKTPRPLTSYIKSDMNIDIENDLGEFKKFIDKTTAT